jgi:DNA-binding FadR family transcriptional regulator
LPLEAIEPRRLYRQIADQIRHLIDQGEYGVGSRLPTERELADMLGVSRPTVREALIALEVEGRLRIRVGSGIYVNAPPSSEPEVHAGPIEGPFEVLRARAFVESAVAEEAARKAEPQDIARLDAILAEVDASAALSVEQWVALDRRFHGAVAETLGNAVLMRTIAELFDQRINPCFRQLAEHVENDLTWRAAHVEHKAIRDAIAAHHPERARVAMRTHLELSHQRFARDFGEAPFVEGGRECERSPAERRLEQNGDSTALAARRDPRAATAC